MKKWKSLVFLLLMLCVGIAGFPAAGKAEESNEIKYYVYNLNKDATQLEKTEYVPSSNDLDFILNDLILKFGSKKSEEKIFNLLPQEVSINSFALTERGIQIDFNTQYSKMSRTREILVRAGIVKTFVQFPGIELVNFTVSGDALTDSKQQPIVDMTEDIFVEYSGTQDQSNYRQDILTLYFTNADGTGLVSEQRKVYYKPSLQKERVVLEQLIKGPMEKGKYPTLSDDISVLAIFTSDDICYVSLTENFIDSALTLDEQLPVYSIVNSLIDSCGCSRVEVTVEGKRDLVFGENMSLYQFYERNGELILTEEVLEGTTE